MVKLLKIITKELAQKTLGSTNGIFWLTNSFLKKTRKTAKNKRPLPKMAKYSINANGSLLLLNLFSLIFCFLASLDIQFIIDFYYKTKVLHKSLIHLYFKILAKEKPISSYFRAYFFQFCKYLLLKYCFVMFFFDLCTEKNTR